jgi:hypothetical protein
MNLLIVDFDLADIVLCLGISLYILRHHLPYKWPMSTPHQSPSLRFCFLKNYHHNFPHELKLPLQSRALLGYACHTLMKSSGVTHRWNE